MDNCFEGKIMLSQSSLVKVGKCSRGISKSRGRGVKRNQAKPQMVGNSNFSISGCIVRFHFRIALTIRCWERETRCGHQGAEGQEGAEVGQGLYRELPA